MPFILAYLKIINPIGLNFLLQICNLCTNHLMLPQGRLLILKPLNMNSSEQWVFKWLHQAATSKCTSYIAYTCSKVHNFLTHA